MARTVYHADAPGLTLYARPYPVTGTWADGVVAAVEQTRTGADSLYAVVVTAEGPGGVYRQAGASPAVGDLEVASYGPENVVAGYATGQSPTEALTDYGVSTFDPLTHMVDVGWVEGTDATDYFAAALTPLATIEDRVTLALPDAAPGASGGLTIYDADDVLVAAGGTYVPFALTDVREGVTGGVDGAEVGTLTVDGSGFISGPVAVAWNGGGETVEVPQHRTSSVALTFTDRDGSAVDLTGLAPAVSVRRYGGSVLFTTSLTVTDAAGGAATLTVTDDETAFADEFEASVYGSGDQSLGSFVLEVTPAAENA